VRKAAIHFPFAKDAEIHLVEGYTATEKAIEKQEKIVYFVTIIVSRFIRFDLLHLVPLRSFTLVQQEIWQQL